MKSLCVYEPFRIYCLSEEPYYCTVLEFVLLQKWAFLLLFDTLSKLLIFIAELLMLQMTVMSVNFCFHILYVPKRIVEHLQSCQFCKFLTVFCEILGPSGVDVYILQNVMFVDQKPC